jgi:hypothetical protein
MSANPYYSKTNVSETIKDILLVLFSVDGGLTHEVKLYVPVQKQSVFDEATKQIHGVQT